MQTVNAHSVRWFHDEWRYKPLV